MMSGKHQFNPSWGLISFLGHFLCNCILPYKINTSLIIHLLNDSLQFFSCNLVVYIYSLTFLLENKQVLWERSLSLAPGFQNRTLTAVQVAHARTHTCPFGCPIAERVCFVKLPFYPGLKTRFRQDYHFVVNFALKKRHSRSVKVSVYHSYSLKCLDEKHGPKW